MDFSVIFQLRTKKFWWMDVIFYFVISLLIATVLSYFIFLVKNGMIRKQIGDQALALQAVGTAQQREHETEVNNYQKKIVDFSGLLKNHEFASNVFAFMQAQTMPNIWFSQFSLDEKNSAVQLSGESDTVDAFSRQVASLETNQYIKDVGTFNSSLGQSAKNEFNLDVVLDPSIFNYLSDISSTQAATTPGQPSSPTITSGLTTPSGTQGAAGTNPSNGSQPTAPATQNISNQKLITSFHFLLTPPVVGVVDQADYAITLTVPYGTDIKNLTPEIVLSPGATIFPASLVSQDFTNPINYIVTAQDGSTQNYQVKLIVANPTAANKKFNQSELIVLTGAAVIIIIVIMVAILLIRRRNKKIA